MNKNNFLNSFKNKLHIPSKISKPMKEILFYGIVPGALINYSLWGIFGVPFNLYTFPAYGIFLYLIKSEVVTIWTHLWFRNPQ